MQLEAKMSTSNTMISSSSLENHSGPGAESPTLQLGKQASSRDVHETRSTHVDPELNSYAEIENINRRASIAAAGADADVAATLYFMKAKILDLEAKLSQMQGQALVSVESGSAPFANGDGTHFDNVTTGLHEMALEEPEAKRKPAKPLLNRVPWVPFKNFYPEEDVFAVDVLMVQNLSRMNVEHMRMHC